MEKALTDRLDVGSLASNVEGELNSNLDGGDVVDIGEAENGE